MSAIEFDGLRHTPRHARAAICDQVWSRLMHLGYSASALQRIRGMLDIWCERSPPELQSEQSAKDDLFLPNLSPAGPWFNNGFFPFEALLEESFEALRTELKKIISEFTNYGVERGAPPMEGYPSGWKMYPLIAQGQVIEESAAIAPVAAAIARTILDDSKFVAQVAFLSLGPGDVLPVHVDHANFMVSCHMGLDVPDNCYIQVAGDRRVWVEGKCISFDNSFNHSAGNESQRARYVFAVHTLHPGLSLEERAALRDIFTGAIFAPDQF